MPTSSKTFSDLSSGDLNFTSIVANEVDSGPGSFADFTSNSPFLIANTANGESGISWTAMTMATEGAPGGVTTQTVTITYNVAEQAGSNNFITSIDASYAVDEALVSSTFTAVETIANSSGIVVGTQSYVFGSPAAGPTQLSMGLKSGVVTLTLTETATASTASLVSASVVDQFFGESTGLAELGDYVWMDSNSNGVQDSGETGVAGVTVELLNGTGTAVLAVTTTNANGFYLFNGLLPNSYEVKFVAPLNDQFTLQSQGGNTATDSNADTSTGITAPVTLAAGQTDLTIDAGLVIPAQHIPGITLDKQISIDGIHWADVTDGVLTGTTTSVANGTVDNDPVVAAGSSVYERVIAVNTGNVTITNAVVTDVETTGTRAAAGFTFSGNGTVASFAAGATITSDIATIVAASDYELDTATIKGTANGGTVTASDVANYTGTVVPAPAITLDKQISIDGTHWADVTDGVLTGTTTSVANGTVDNDPVVAAGSNVYERVIAVNTGNVTITNAVVTDVETTGTGAAAGFTFSGNGTVASFAPGATITSDIATIVAASDYERDTATIKGTANGGTLTASDVANYTGTVVPAPAITLDKQISTDGTHWADVTDGVLTGTTTSVANGTVDNDPVVAAGSNVYERVIAVNTGNVVITNAVVTDVVSLGTGAAAGFTFSGNGTVASFAPGATLTSDIATIVAASDYELDTATITGKANGGTLIASDKANYTGTVVPAPAITLDKQISTDGTHWADVTDGVLTGTTTSVANGTVDNDPVVAAGSNVYERVIAVNTGNVTITNAVVTDVETTGTGAPAGFTFAGNGTVASFAAGATITSDIATIVAASDYERDTATIKGTANGGTVTASDQANYTGTVVPAPAITLDKQISTDGTHWADVNDGVLTGTTTSVANGTVDNDPVVAAGSNVYERVIAVNTGNVTITNAVVTDVETTGTGAAAGFTFSGNGTVASFAPGATITSDIATIVAASDYERDTATIKGLANGGTVTASDQANYTGTSTQVDLSILKDDGKTTVSPGGVDTYTITVTNNGPATVTSFNMVDNIPTQLLNPIFGVPSSGSYNSNTGAWTGVNLASGQHVSITLTGTISPTAAGPVTYTASGTASDGPESGTATVTVQNGQITVTLASNIANPTSAGQEVSGIQFTLGNTPTSASLTSAAGTLIDITGGGAVTSDPGSITHWGVAQSGSTLTLATAGAGSVGGKPIDLIIGSGPYTNANPSITGRNGQIAGTATFILKVPGVTSATQVSGVKIEFGTGPDSVVTSTSSGGSGSITNTATVSAPAGFTDTNPNNNVASDTDTITTGGALTGAIGDYVWFDANHNGLQDSNETGVPGVTVDLLSGTSVIGVTTTNASGLYSFTGLAAGTYNVQFVAPAGDNFTSASQGTNTAINSNANVTSGLTAPITLAAGQTDLTIDAGLVAQPPPTTADLSIVKTDGKTSVVAGASDTYTITVTNNGPATVTSFNMVDSIPTLLLNPVFGAPSSGSYNATTGLWSGVSLASGQSVSIPVTGTVSPTAGASSSYVASGSGSDGPESGTATVTAGNGQIFVTLTAGQNSPTAAGQEISGIQFTLSNAPSSATLGSALGNLINIAGGGGVTTALGSITHWGVAESGSTLTLATAGTGAVGGKPIDLIIGSGPYTNANPSITGRNPQIQGTATFVVNAPGVTPSTTISGVHIEFGTGPDSVLTTTQSGGSGSLTNTAVVSTTGGITDPNSSNNSASDTNTITPVISSSVAGNLSVNGTPPASSLNSLYGNAQMVEFAYNPSTTVSVTTATIGAASGGLPSNPAFIVISNNANPNAATAIYFEGTVTTGEDFYANAAINPVTNTPNSGAAAFMSTASGQHIFADIYSSQAAFIANPGSPVQVDSYNTSGSQAMFFNDQIGSLRVVGYVGSTGGHVTA